MRECATVTCQGFCGVLADPTVTASYKSATLPWQSKLCYWGPCHGCHQCITHCQLEQVIEGSHDENVGVEHEDASKLL